MGANYHDKSSKASRSIVCGFKFHGSLDQPKDGAQCVVYHVVATYVALT